MRDKHPHKISIVKGPPVGGLFREAWSTLRLPFVRVFWRSRERWLMHRGVIRARRWRNPGWIVLLIIVMWIASLVLVAWVTWAVGSAIRVGHGGWYWGPFNPDKDNKWFGSVSYGVINGLVTPVLTLALSTLIFLALRVYWVRHRYKRRAAVRARDLVQTAGSLMGDVVGRDYLCDAIMNNLRDRRFRRTHVIVGGVGTGKTALLVRLTQKLVAVNAVPVPVRLRDVQQASELDFGRLARERFTEIVEPFVLSDAERDRIWHWLRERSDRVVVLADGLDEALVDDSVVGLRDNIIREAIRKANDSGLPLVIASRPHDPLRAMQAAVTWLEPLSDEAAVDYIARGGSWRADETLLDRVAEAAKVAESPLYLQIARDLHRQELLEPLWIRANSPDLSLQDTWAFRHDLLSTWLDALVDGTVHPELPIAAGIRQAVVEYISAFACIGLATDRSVVSLHDLDLFLGNARDGKRDAAGSPDGKHDSWQWRDYVADYLGQRMSDLQRPRRGSGQDEGERPTVDPYMDVHLAATWGERMGLVDAVPAVQGRESTPDVGTAIHFQHSVIQAYLGSRFIPAILGETSPLEERESGTKVRSQPSVVIQAQLGHRSVSVAVGGTALSSAPAGSPNNPERTPRKQLKNAGELLKNAVLHGGNELVIALILYSRSRLGKCTGHVDTPDSGEHCPVALMCKALEKASADLLEMGEELSRRPYRSRSYWSEKRNRFFKEDGYSLSALECFAAAVDIASVDDNPAIKELIKEDQWKSIALACEDIVRLREAKMATVRQCGSAARRVIDKHANESPCKPMFKVGCAERDFRVRYEIAAQIGEVGACAFDDLRDDLRKDFRVFDEYGKIADNDHAAMSNPFTQGSARSLAEDNKRIPWLEPKRQRQRRERIMAEIEARAEEDNWNRCTMQAWLLPMLVDSADMTNHEESPRKYLELLVTGTMKPGEPGLAPPDTRRAHRREGERYAVELALAQGFKYAANRRPTPQSDKGGREFLAKQAQELLKRSPFWYTRLTLLQALTLWALPDNVTEPRQIRGSGADPKGQVKEWLQRQDGQPQHPLVRAGAKLAVRALQTRRPERFMWVDDYATASRIGTEVGAPGVPRAHNLWIPPSTGWASLDPAAQQLLADVLVLAVLGERDGRPGDLFQVLERIGESSNRLPSCLSRDRSLLDPARTMVDAEQPGKECADDCRLNMCPYPDKAGTDLRIEFDELFCLHQREMLQIWQPNSWLYLRFRRESPWQRKVPIAGMRRFWNEMGERARDVRQENDARTARTRIRT